MTTLPQRLRLTFAVALAAAALAGCKSHQDEAIAHAKEQAAKTGQPQSIVTRNSDGSTTTTIVNPPAPGQTVETVVTTTTPAGVPPPQVSNPDTSSAAPSPAPAPPPPPPVDIAAGTELTIRIDQRISTKTSHPGDTFTGEIVRPVTDANGNIVVPKGTPVNGVVDVSQRGGHYKGSSTLELRLTALTLNGTTYPLKTADLERTKKGKGKRSAAIIGGGSGLGMLVGGLTHGGVGLLVGGLVGGGAGTAAAGLTDNRPLDIPAESVVRFKLRGELVLQPPTQPGAGNPSAPSH
jgi:hypothetical protein